MDLGRSATGRLMKTLVLTELSFVL